MHQGGYYYYYMQDNSQSWGALWSHGHQDPKQSMKSNKDPTEGVTFVSRVACWVILHNWISASSEVFIQVQQVMLASAQTPCSAKR